MSDKNEFELLPDQPSKKRQPQRRKNMDDFADWEEEGPKKKSGGGGALVIGLVIGALFVFTVIGGLMAFIVLKPAGEGRPKKVQASRAINASPGQLGSFTISGPDGQFQFPPAEVTIVNVFLQACPDCMPSFNVYRDSQGFEDVAPVVNIAYNSASKDWLKDYYMDTNLYFDRGGRLVVNPQGIRKFTTLVVDRDSKIHLKIQPTEAGYVDKVRAKIRELKEQ
ncbi:MAG: hypothetical protein P1V97_31170 [Planctomycetota bacterium]|nr:hypothetical protein [Planctomycetota bacterium]